MPNKPVLSDSIVGSTDASPSTFVCSWSSGGLDAGWVRVAGELDLASVPVLELTLREPQLQSHLVVLDLRKLVFMDCTGARAIVDATIRARKAGHRLVLVNGSPDVKLVFTLTGRTDDVEIGDFAPIAPLRALL
jgi:anti-sigma B factor antagonist